MTYSNSLVGTPVRSLSVASLPEQHEDEFEDEEEDGPVLIPPPDYSDDGPSNPVSVSSTPSPKNTVSIRALTLTLQLLFLD